MLIGLALIAILLACVRSIALNIIEEHKNNHQDENEN